MPNDIIDGAERTISTNITGDVYVTAKQWFLALDPGGAALKSYWEGIKHALDRIQIMGMSGDRAISRVYVSLRFYPDYRKALTSRPDPKQVFDGEESISLNKGMLSFDSDAAIRRLGYGHIVPPKAARSKKDQLTSHDTNGPVVDPGCMPNVEEWETEEQFERRVNKEAQQRSTVLHGLDAFSFVDKHNKLVILGQPGSGKTTFLKYLALAYTGYLPSARDTAPRIPIFIPLRDFTKEGNPNGSATWFLRFASRCATEISSAANTSAWIEKKLKEGSCAILVDGFDEVPSNLIADVLRSFRAFVNTYHMNKYVVTCRTASFFYSLEGFKVCEVDDFDENDVRTFAAQWFESNDNSLKRFLADLAKSSAAKELCKTPLLTTMTCIMYEYNHRIPENRFELYESCLDALMYRWDAFRNIDRSKRVDSVSNSRKRYILSNIARKTFDRETIYIRRKHLIGLLSAELDGLGVEATPEKLLTDFESNVGIFVERVAGVYCFSHFTFHEFLVSLTYLERNEMDDLFELVMDNPRYREVFLLAMENLHLPDKIAVMLASRTKNAFLREKKGSIYIRDLLVDLLLSQAVFSKNVRRLLREILIELEIYS